MDDVFERMVAAAKKNKGCVGHGDISTLLNVSPQVITNWSKRKVPRSQVATIASVLGVTTDWLLTGKELPNTPPLAANEVALSRQEQIILELFRDLTDNQKTEAVRSLEAQKQQNDKLWEELSKIKGKKAG
ncbi:MAG: hypothetical protein BWK73_26755 [Thiothrix lacustris]|uniref:Bacteriophage CI repressor N-terminal domain-containing protein n=1 Tax=Thiothrix lacustris TaxID=525917 RepID=A0A1Y1QKX5_9GAMM|nr:MAG: hypothetical protein BWK73_26755 [Thiothrix lacustris]